MERGMSDTREQISSANKNNVVISLAPEPRARCGVLRWSAMDEMLSSGYLDEIRFASRSLH